MNQWLGWLSSTAGLGVIGASIAFIVSTTQQFFQRRAEAAERQFQAFHEIVKKVVSPESNDGLFYIDRQAAVVFELRHFSRYYDFTERLLQRLRKKWANEPPSHVDPPPRVSVLLEEIDLTLAYIKKHRRFWS
jgi:hypothetical protein